MMNFGSPGDGPGQFGHTQQIAVDTAGDLYVTDGSGNGYLTSRVQKFDSDGNFLLQFGAYGSGLGHMTGVSDVAIAPDGRVYASSYQGINGNEIQIFDASGNPLDQMDKYSSRGIAINQVGDVFVGGGSEMTKFVSHEIATEWDAGDDLLFDVEVDGEGYIYVAAGRSERVKRFDSGGNFIFEFAINDHPSCPNGQPMGLSFDSSDNLWIVCHDGIGFMKFTKYGEFLKEYVSQGTGDGQFISTQGIAVDQTGNIFVSDFYGYRIQKFREN